MISLTVACEHSIGVENRLSHNLSAGERPDSAQPDGTDREQTAPVTGQL